jgi:hypothetical protein
VTEDEKQDGAPKDTFLNTAARAVGTTLGKLAAKTGLAHPAEKPKVRPPASPAKKKSASNPPKLVRKPVAKKKRATPKKTGRLVTKTKG